LSEVWVGRTLSKVQIQQLIGRGGMADVYLGLHTTLNVPRAVKILHGHLSDDPDLMRRFRDEAKSVAALRHPNIVQVYDFDLADGRPYIVMELLRGQSMAAYIKGLHALGHTLPLETVARLLDAIASALDYAHSQGIVHRDVKPSNVILRQGSTPLLPSIPLPPDSQPVLTDFGIARISGATSQTLTGTILGTPAYMSPEQVRGEPVDARSDNYSLGIMLYEMLAGVLPFDPEVDTTASVLYKQANVPPPPLPNVGPRIQAVVDRALHKDPDARYQKAGDLAAAFRSVGEAGAATVVSAPARSGRTTASPMAGRPSRRWPIWIGLATALAVVVAGVVLGSLTRGVGPTRTPTTQPAVATATEATVVEASPPATTPTVPVVVSAPIVGGALFLDSSLQAVVRDVLAPEPGRAYAAWLIGADGLSQLAGAEYAQGVLTIQYVDPDGGNLLADFNEFAVSLEPDPDPAPDVPGPIRFVSNAPQDLVAEIRRLDEETRGAPMSMGLVDGLRTQAEAHDTHVHNSLSAIEAGNLPGAKQHAEHVINILVGTTSPDFGDWNGDARAQNPGDGFGAVPYLKLALALAQSELANPDASLETLEGLQALVADLEAALQVAEESLEMAKSLASTDTVEEASVIAADWAELLLRQGAARAALFVEQNGLRLWVPVRAAP